MPIWKKLFLLSLLALVGIAYLGIYHIAPYAIIQPYRATAQLKEIPPNMTVEPIAVWSADSLRLSGLHLRPNAIPVRGFMILVHGIGGCKEHMLPLAVGLAQEGIACLWIDSRAHGQSEGKYCTYGYLEKYDMQQLLRYGQQLYPDIPSGIWGNSLGGAVAIQALELEEDIHFGIIESTFTNLDQIVYDYQKRYTHGFGAHWATRLALKEAGQLANFPPETIKPIQSVTQIEQAVLIAHGTADANISSAYGQQLYDALAGTDKELILVPGGGHSNLGSKGGEDYWQQILTFINRQLLVRPDRNN